MLSPNKKKILFVLLLVLIGNLSFSFYFVMKDVKMKLNIIEPAVKLFINKDNYYVNSSDSVVLSEKILNEEDNIEISEFDLENKTSLVIPFYLDQSALPSSLRKDYNLSLKVYSSLLNASNVFEVWIAYINSSCSNGKELTKVKKNGSSYTYKVCGIKKFTDKNESSEYFNTLNFNITEPKAVVIKFNPLYKGNFNLTIKPSIYEIE